VLRAYTRPDLEAMVELDRECFGPPFRFNLSAMKQFAEAGNAWVTVAVEEDRMLGFCIVHREREDEAEFGYLVTIDVAESARRRRLGESMLSAAEAWIRGWEGEGMLLHVLVENLQAVRFYERMGYRRLGEHPAFYGPGLNAAMYWKDLTGME
jgi:[ribosomal protein S18]-alanine N-acetyltransferase